MKAEEKPSAKNDASAPDFGIRDLRREIISAETRISELQDQITRRETERADAVALLGQMELVLEQKIGYIITLDQSLNTRIQELEKECDRKTIEIENRGSALREAENRDEKNRTERDAVINDLSHRLDQANQETSKAHDIAREIDQARAKAIEERDYQSSVVAQLSEELEKVRNLLSAEKSKLSEVSTQHEQTHQKLEKTLSQLSSTAQTLSETKQKLVESQQIIADIKGSLLWRLSRPWRALFGPKK
ncbi:MAG: hypothetical protein SynsKO_20260 [Synoicihabitans sp.]